MCFIKYEMANCFLLRFRLERFINKKGALGETRTHNLRIRSPMRGPIELRGHD